MKYLIEHERFSLVATYTRGTLTAFRMQRGTIPEVDYQTMHFWLPRREEALKLPMNGIIVTKHKEKSADGYYQQYVDAWFGYYERTTGLRPRFNAADGASLKGIKKHLEAETATQDEALGTWQALLANLHRIDKFYSQNADLKFIYSQINKIIIQLKNVTTKARKGHNATDLRREL
jgi:hypothetical protein